jgi:phage gp37-like protein
MIVLGVFLLAAAVLMATQVRWGELIGPAVMVFFLYRVVRDRRRRMMARFTKKVAMLPEVKAVAVRNDQIIVVLDRAPAKTYIRVSSLLDGANAKLFYGKPITGTIRDDMTDEELRTLIKQPGAVYVRDDVVFGPPGGGSTSGGSLKSGA